MLNGRALGYFFSLSHFSLRVVQELQEFFDACSILGLRPDQLFRREADASLECFPEPMTCRASDRLVLKLPERVDLRLSLLEDHYSAFRTAPSKHFRILYQLSMLLDHGFFIVMVFQGNCGRVPQQQYLVQVMSLILSSL
jgi:hypothetical protein